MGTESTENNGYLKLFMEINRSYLFNTSNGNFIINSQLSVGLDQVVIHFSGAEDEFLHAAGVLGCLTFIGDYSSELGSWRSNIITVFAMKSYLMYYKVKLCKFFRKEMKILILITLS